MDRRRIFISYSRGDTEDALSVTETQSYADTIINKLKEKLEGESWKVIVDKDDLQPGDNFISDLQKFIRTSHIVISIISKGALGKSFVNQELGYTLANRVPMYIIRLDDVVPKDMLQSLHFCEKDMFEELAIEDENKVYAALKEKSQRVLKGFKWENGDNLGCFESIIEENIIWFQQKYNKSKNEELIIRYSGTVENCVFLNSSDSRIQSYLSNFLNEQKADYKLVFYVPKEADYVQGKIINMRLKHLRERFSKDNIYKIKEYDGNEPKSELILNNYLLFQISNSELHNSPYTFYAPYISREIEKFNISFKNTDGNKKIDEIEKKLDLRPDLSEKISIENRTLKFRAGLDNDLKSSKTLYLFVTTLNSFRIGLEEELKKLDPKSTLRNLFPNLKLFKIFVYSHDINLKHPPGTSKEIASKEWNSNLEFVLEVMSQIASLNFELVILNTLPSFTGVYAEENEKKILFKLTTHFRDTEPIKIPQFIVWKDELMHSSTIDRFKYIIKGIENSRSHFKYVIKNSNPEWNRFSKNNISDIRLFVRSLKELTSDFPCCKNDLFNIHLKSKGIIKDESALLSAFFTLKDGFKDIQFSQEKWTLTTEESNSLNYSELPNKHVLAAFAIIIDPEDDKSVLLIDKPKPNLKWRYDVPGGKLCKLDKDLENTVVREVFEELGFFIKVENLERIFIKYDKLSVKEGDPCIPVYFKYTIDKDEKEYLDIVKKDTKGYSFSWLKKEELLDKRYNSVEICHIPHKALKKALELSD